MKGDIASQGNMASQNIVIGECYAVSPQFLNLTLLPSLISLYGSHLDIRCCQMDIHDYQMDIPWISSAHPTDIQQ